MKGEKLDMRNFHERGPLEMKTEYRGSVRHDLDDESSGVLESLKYDPGLNSLVLIGTQVERLTRHDLDDESSGVLESLKYDPGLNSLVLIGTQVERLTPGDTQSGAPSVSRFWVK
ncbi:hypothetical protein COOONC_02200 [Cooperia oncophora]